MKLTKWEPLSLWLEPSQSLRDLSHWFDDDFASVLGSGNFQPALDVYEEDGKIRVKADMPGLSEKDINVEVKDSCLMISGEKKDEKTEKKDGYYYSERSFGSFKRSVRLPDGINYEQIKASFKDGVLDIEIPESEVRKPKKIEIKA